MSKTLLYRLFRIGALPKSKRAGLESEGLQCLDEGIPLTISWRRYREPGRYIAQRCQSLTGALALSQRRLVLSAASRTVLDINLEDPVSHRLTVAQPTSETLSLSLKAEDFQPNCSGQITYLLSTSRAAAFIELWQKRPAASSRQ